MESKRVTIYIDENNLESVKKAEIKKAKLENAGYKVISTFCGFTRSIITMAPCNERVTIRLRSKHDNR